MTRENGVIVLNPHLANCCVLRLMRRPRRCCITSLESGWDELAPAPYKPDCAIG